MSALSADLAGYDRTDVRRQLALDDLLVFTRRMFPAYQIAGHHKEIALRLQAVASGEIKRLIITMPPRHGKSELASVHFPAWYLAKHPDSRIIACSNTQRLAERFSRQARNKFYQAQWPFPEIEIASDMGQVQSWDIANHRGGYIAAGVGGSITGFGANCILIDDPVKSIAQADSPTYRESTWEWYQGTLRTRLEPGGSIVVIGTRWHEDDLIGRLLLNNEGWDVLHLPAIDDDGNALWPDQWPVEELELIKADTGSRNWEAQYQGRPSPAEGGMFKRHWWRYWQPVGANLPPVAIKMPGGRTEYVEPVTKMGFPDRAVQSWDMTFKQTVEGSFVVGLVGEQYGSEIFLTDIFRDRVDFPGTINAFRTVTAKHPETSAKLVEEKANGAAVIDSLKRSIPGIVAVQVDGSKEARAHAGSSYVEAGNVLLPHPVLAPWIEDFIAEHASFPTGAHDDQVDTLSQMIRYLFGASRELRAPTGSLRRYLAEQ